MFVFCCDLFVMNQLFTIIYAHNAKYDTNLIIMHTTIHNEMRYNYNVKLIS